LRFAEKKIKSRTERSPRFPGCLRIPALVASIRAKAFQIRVDLVLQIVVAPSPWISRWQSVNVSPSASLPVDPFNIKSPARPAAPRAARTLRNRLCLNSR
jgi:hypothetical protein